jgi:hypothetical protein
VSRTEWTNVVAISLAPGKNKQVQVLVWMNSIALQKNPRAGVRDNGKYTYLLENINLITTYILRFTNIHSTTSIIPILYYINKIFETKIILIEWLI